MQLQWICLKERDGKDTMKSTKSNKFQIQSIHKQKRQKMKAELRW